MKGALGSAQESKRLGFVRALEVAGIVENCRTGWCSLGKGLQEWAQSLQGNVGDEMDMAPGETGEHKMQVLTEGGCGERTGQVGLMGVCLQGAIVLIQSYQWLQKRARGFLREN